MRNHKDKILKKNSVSWVGNRSHFNFHSVSLMSSIVKVGEIYWSLWLTSKRGKTWKLEASKFNVMCQLYWSGIQESGSMVPISKEPVACIWKIWRPKAQFTMKTSSPLSLPTLSTLSTHSLTLTCLGNRLHQVSCLLCLPPQFFCSSSHVCFTP